MKRECAIHYAVLCGILAFAVACERSPAMSDEYLRSAGARAAGAELFAANCAICHGERGDGRGIRRAGFDVSPPDFRTRSWRDRTSPEHVAGVIRHGKKPSSMPAWPNLSDEEIGQLVAYVRSLSEQSRP